MTWQPLYNITTSAFMTSDSLHMTSPPGFMTSRPLYLWHHRHYVCEYMSTIFNIKHTVLRHYNHYIWNHKLHMCICVITHNVSMILDTLYLWHGTYYIYGPICTVCDFSPSIYDITTLYPLHQSIISHIKLIISCSTSTVSLSSHPDYWSYNPHCMYDNTGTICVTSYEYIWHHIHSLTYHTMLWHSHTLYSCHHTQDACHHIHCSWAITYSVLIIAHVQYVWYQTH